MMWGTQLCNGGQLFTMWGTQNCNGSEYRIMWGTQICKWGQSHMGTENYGMLFHFGTLVRKAPSNVYCSKLTNRQTYGQDGLM